MKSYEDILQVIPTLVEVDQHKNIELCLQKNKIEQETTKTNSTA